MQDQGEKPFNDHHSDERAPIVIDKTIHLESSSSSESF